MGMTRNEVVQYIDNFITGCPEMDYKVEHLPERINILLTCDDGELIGDAFYITNEIMAIDEIDILMKARMEESERALKEHLSKR